ncbi:MAG TPA: radical SAM protein, partial [Thermoanaerobaculia bacterium]|nr:radical SAM protein [Thermoanaerobaculia bacterium]
MRNALYSGLRLTADGFWRLTRAIDRRIEQNSFQPRWAPAPLLKQKDRTFPKFGFPRETDSLCPKCVTEVRTKILSGNADWKVLVDGNPGEIKAQIVEEDGKILMKKDCPEHGHFEDVMSTDPAFFKRLESLYPGRDFVIPKDGLHEHGTSSIKYGRGAVLTIDLTNRCNMMCNPCFMDANQVGYVHELDWEEIQKLLDDAVSIKPRRQLSVQFSGGEPTISPHFLRAIQYAREVGYFSVQCATNGIRFAQDEDFARQAAEAGLRFAYLQFDGVSNEANEHRKVGNLYDVKQRAIENLHKHGVDITLVTTIVNTVND